MKKILLKTITLALIMAGIISCGKDDKSNELNEPVKLKGSGWMLEGIVDVKTGEMRELEVDYNECAFIHFDTDSTAVGCWGASEIYLHLSPQLVSVVIKDEDASYTGDLQLFYETIKTITAYDVIIFNDFSITSKLKLYCNAGNNYLLYKRVGIDKNN
ncbi:MAG: hypothetical protein LBP63_07610 [Prevotellaceae bacterium]|nr:hypothetical protein [Prevotellaceae bacterium]